VRVTLTRCLVLALLILLAACTDSFADSGSAAAEGQPIEVDLPCDGDPDLLDQGPTEPVVVTSAQFPGMVAYVFEVEDEIEAIDIQKFFFAHCGAMEVVEEPRQLLGDIAWRNVTAEGWTSYGTVAKRLDGTVVVATVELECVEDSCPNRFVVYELLSAAAYMIANVQ
jgi:hypothetical protein